MCCRKRRGQLGVSSESIASTLNTIVGGSSITQVRDGIYLVEVIGRARTTELTSLETFQNLQLPAKDGQSVPLGAVARFAYEIEQPVVWRRNRQPTITIMPGIRYDPAGVPGRQLQPPGRCV